MEQVALRVAEKQDFSAPGRRADILVVDGNPTVNIWNARRISTLIMDGNVMDRDGLLRLRY